MTAPQEPGPSELGAPEAAPNDVPSVAALDVPVASPPPKKARGNALLNWVLVRDELSLARENAARITSQQREFIRRAKLAFELGERAAGPRDDSATPGSSAPVVADLFRQALYWAILAQTPSYAGAEPAVAWASLDATQRASISSNEAELAQIENAMRASFVELGELSPEAQGVLAALLRRAANRLVTSAQRAPWQLEWSKLKRITRLGLLAFILLAAVAAGVVLWPAPPDLAKGKPWHTSSSLYECHPEKSDCGGTATDILFHTTEEQSPWFEYDLGARLAFSSLTIRNRSDYGPERAVPLVVEVSNDDKKFTEIARRTSSFSTWKPSFPTQHARYLRLRVDRVSMLHLEAVKVHP